MSSSVSERGLGSIISSCCLAIFENVCNVLECIFCCYFVRACLSSEQSYNSIIDPESRTPSNHLQNREVRPESSHDTPADSSPIVRSGIPYDIQAEPAPIVHPVTSRDISAEPLPIVRPGTSRDIEAEPLPIVRPGTSRDMQTESSHQARSVTSGDIQADSPPIVRPGTSRDMQTESSHQAHSVTSGDIQAESSPQAHPGTSANNIEVPPSALGQYSTVTESLDVFSALLSQASYLLSKGDSFVCVNLTRHKIEKMLDNDICAPNLGVEINSLRKLFNDVTEVYLERSANAQAMFSQVNSSVSVPSREALDSALEKINWQLEEILRRTYQYLQHDSYHYNNRNKPQFILEERGNTGTNWKRDFNDPQCDSEAESIFDLREQLARFKVSINTINWESENMDALIQILVQGIEHPFDPMMNAFIQHFNNRLKVLNRHVPNR